MSGVLDLVREDLRDFAGYASARTQRLEGEVWLNANEAPLSNPGDADGRCRRYPSPQPPELQARLAEVDGVDAGQLLIGGHRGCVTSSPLIASIIAGCSSAATRKSSVTRNSAPVGE